MSESGLLTAFILDGRGGALPQGWEDLADWTPRAGPLWVHLNRESRDTREWLENSSGIDPMVVEALLAESTRPRCVSMNDGVMLFLRGVNLNPGADPEDMVSIRLWIEPQRIVSVRLRRLLSVDDLRKELLDGKGPVDVGHFVVRLADHMVSRMVDVMSDIDDAVDRLQGEVLESGSSGLRTELTHLRHEIITLRRYLAPQRDALARLAQLKLAWLREDELLQLREEIDRVTRYVEDLDAARERASVTQEELSNLLSEQLNSRMYVLSVVAAIFLPLGFLTGLFGINVGGIPLAENPWGFWEVSGLLVLIALVQLAVFRWRRWF